MNHTKICIISVYFGPFPHYFSLWLKSCQFNPTIDFLLVTDQKIATPLPPNVLLFSYTLAQMRARATEILGFPTALERPYKCCDYKPLYGVLFEEQLKQYNYWGHCDMDMIFGDIRAFTDKYNLPKYDKFLPLGHLSLYRNTPEVNQRYKLNGAGPHYQPLDYHTVFSNEQNFIFDELPGIYSIYKKHNFPMFTKRIFADIASIFTRYRIIEDTTFDSSSPHNYKQQIFYWENGKIWRAYVHKVSLNTEEYIYIHFKKRPNFMVNFDVTHTHSFYITDKGFYPKENLVTLQVIRKLVPYQACHEKYECVRNYMRNRYGKVKGLIRGLIKR